jgi:DNA primase
MIDRAQIDQIRQATDLPEIVREYVPTLTRAGKTFKGLCPFHSERTPSFFVNPELSIFKCFGCNEGGDAISFLMKIDHLTFWEAASKLAERSGVTLQITNSRTPERESERSRLHRVLSLAAAFYQTALESPVGQACRKYLEKRSVSEKTARSFGLGFAPFLGEAAIEHCLKGGFTIDDLQKAGLALRSQESGRFRDPLGGRLIFPIHDLMGHIVGFGGRLLESEGRAPWSPEGNSGPKYLNSPDTPIFKKGALLYGLHQAKGSIAKEGRALVVEGYMDVIGCHQAGNTFAVAPLGTALTTDHARLLKRYARETTLFFDADSAGYEATQRTLGLMIGLDLLVRVAPHPDQRDADEFIAQEGPEAWAALLGTARDGIDYLLEARLKGSRPQALHERVQIAEEMLCYVAESPNDILKQEWVRKISQRLFLDEGGLLRQMNRIKPVRRTQDERPPAPRASQDGPHRFSVEGEIVQILLSEPVCWTSCILTADDFMDPRSAEIFGKMVQAREEGAGFSGLLERLTPPAQDYFSFLATQGRTFEQAQEYFASASQRLKMLRVKKEQQELAEQIRTAPEGPGKQEALTRYRDLLKILGALERRQAILQTP